MPCKQTCVQACENGFAAKTPSVRKTSPQQQQLMNEWTMRMECIVRRCWSVFIFIAFKCTRNTRNHPSEWQFSREHFAQTFSSMTSKNSVVRWKPELHCSGFSNFPFSICDLSHAKNPQPHTRDIPIFSTTNECPPILISFSARTTPRCNTNRTTICCRMFFILHFSIVHVHVHISNQIALTNFEFFIFSYCRRRS